ncbi:hypothetical protein N3K66_005389 [Trichothecium roseum]|uniref:Uncharacterized protein n=1 Tax=Trichothecium roseum TaxID=47278 RepID=A0ACC0UXQ7_9HYPO|nr:hypothetical protein N3K66_005389 [Trichothecium roseum]
MPYPASPVAEHYREATQAQLPRTPDPQIHSALCDNNTCDVQTPVAGATSSPEESRVLNVFSSPAAEDGVDITRMSSASSTECKDETSLGDETQSDADDEYANVIEIVKVLLGQNYKGPDSHDDSVPRIQEIECHAPRIAKSILSVGQKMDFDLAREPTITPSHIRPGQKGPTESEARGKLSPVPWKMYGVTRRLWPSKQHDKRREKLSDDDKNIFK